VTADVTPTVLTEGARRILALHEVGVKVYVTAPGTETPSGTITDVRTTSASHSRQRRSSRTRGRSAYPSCNVDDIERTGEAVRRMIFEKPSRDSFWMLPGGTRLGTIVDRSCRQPLPPGIYQVLVVLDCGADDLIGFTRRVSGRRITDGPRRLGGRRQHLTLLCW
jgi:hypothetical protein